RRSRDDYLSSPHVRPALHAGVSWRIGMPTPSSRRGPGPNARAATRRAGFTFGSGKPTAFVGCHPHPAPRHTGALTHRPGAAAPAPWRRAVRGLDLALVVDAGPLSRLGTSTRAGLEPRRSARGHW